MIDKAFLCFTNITDLETGQLMAFEGESIPKGSEEGKRLEKLIMENRSQFRMINYPQGAYRYTRDNVTVVSQIITSAF